jgi:hypothetical protein
MTKPDFTTKDAKSTKFTIRNKPFVAFVRFVVRQYSVAIECFGNESNP